MKFPTFAEIEAVEQRLDRTVAFMRVILTDACNGLKCGANPRLALVSIAHHAASVIKEPANDISELLARLVGEVTPNPDQGTKDVPWFVERDRLTNEEFARIERHIRVHANDVNHELADRYLRMMYQEWRAVQWERNEARDRLQMVGAEPAVVTSSEAHWEVISDDDNVMHRVRWSEPCGTWGSGEELYLYTAHYPDRHRAERQAEQWNEEGRSPGSFRGYTSGKAQFETVAAASKGGCHEQPVA